ncbi:MAG TPA: VOC family protein [Pseudonocardiaceae bacterium]|nr:VOC family protein [Pseudonocardiaceae bacterium]
MSDAPVYPQGTPCWMDLWTPNRQASMDFYAGVFGWTYRVGPAEQHSYTEALIEGKTVAGIVTPPGANQNTPMVWTTYLSVDDVDAARAAITEHGGQDLTGVITVPGTGIRIVLGVDPTGGMVGAWQAPDHGGAELTNVPGTQIWNELMTPDPAAARQFYSAVFGVQISEPFPDFDYTTINVNGREVGGIGKSGDGAPAGWSVYFSVADTNAAADLVRSGGGSVLSEPADTPYGRMSACADPHGSTFNLMGPNLG